MCVYVCERIREREGHKWITGGLSYCFIQQLNEPPSTQQQHVSGQINEDIIFIAYMLKNTGTGGST